MSQVSMSSATSSSTASNGLSALPASPPSARDDDDDLPKHVQLPLTSFANTPQNVACISFLLGSVFALGVRALLLGPMQSVDHRIVEVLSGPKLGGYAASWAVFHLLEYVVTAIWNPTRVTVSCAVLSQPRLFPRLTPLSSTAFLLNNGAAYHVAHFVGVTEYILEELSLPPSLRAYKHLRAPTVLGVSLLSPP